MTQHPANKQHAHGRPAIGSLPRPSSVGSLRCSEESLFVAAKAAKIWLYGVIVSGAVPDDPPSGTTDFCGLRRSDMLRIYDQLNEAVREYEACTSSASVTGTPS